MSLTSKTEYLEEVSYQLLTDNTTFHWSLKILLSCILPAVGLSVLALFLVLFHFLLSQIYGPLAVSWWHGPLLAMSFLAYHACLLLTRYALAKHEIRWLTRLNTSA